MPGLLGLKMCAVRGRVMGTVAYREGPPPEADRKCTDTLPTRERDRRQVHTGLQGKVTLIDVETGKNAGSRGGSRRGKVKDAPGV